MNLWSASSAGLARAQKRFTACQTTPRSTRPPSPQPPTACPTQSPSSINPSPQHPPGTVRPKHVNTYVPIRSCSPLTCRSVVLTTNTQSIYWQFRCSWQSSDWLDYFDQRRVQCSGQCDTSVTDATYSNSLTWRCPLTPPSSSSICVVYNISKRLTFISLPFFSFFLSANKQTKKMKEECCIGRNIRGIVLERSWVMLWKRRMMVEPCVGKQHMLL